jgi:hypothetical protein
LTKGDIRDGRKHALVEAKEQVRHLGAADAGLAQYLHQAKVGEVPDVGAARVGEGERVAPEEPLEADDGYRYQGQPYQRQGGLSACKTTVEEADARHHEEDEG